MKEFLLILAIIFLVGATMVLIGTAEAKGKLAPKKCECICPTLEQLLKEKEQAAKDAQEAVGLKRREQFKDLFRKH